MMILEEAPPCSEDPEKWFSFNMDDIAEAIEICKTCPIVEKCREASENERWGVWGGVDRELGLREYRRGRGRERGSIPWNKGLRRSQQDTSRDLPPGDPRHGLDTGYRTWGCRCDICVEGDKSRRMKGKCKDCGAPCSTNSQRCTTCHHESRKPK